MTVEDVELGRLRILGQTMNWSLQLRHHCTWNPQALVDGHPWPLPPPRWEKKHRAEASIVTTITMRDRAKNRKPNQRGRYLSIEAIQAVQALKRSGSVLGDPLERVLACKVRRLIKGDMVAVLLELQSQREGLLALKVFEEVRKEHWYKPQLLSYNNMIELLASCSLSEEVEQVFSYLKTEHLGADTEGFNSLLKTLLDFGFIASAMGCFRLMKLWESEPDESTYSILINGLKAKGETDLSRSIRHEAEQHIGGVSRAKLRNACTPSLIHTRDCYKTLYMEDLASIVSSLSYHFHLNFIL